MPTWSLYLIKMSSIHNNPKKPSTTKMTKHLASVYSLFTHCSVDPTKNRLDCYRDKDYGERFCKNLT